MVCLRYIDGKEIRVDLTGLYEGRTAFLVGGSPTLLLQDYRRLADRNILSFGINNAGKVVRCGGYFLGDNPRCYFNSVVHDKSAIRFVNNGYQRYFENDENVYFFTRKDGQPSVSNVYGEDVVAGNNTLGMALFMLLSFKVARIVLCGSTFNAGSYGHGQTLDEKERNWNSRLYTQQAKWIRSLSGLFGSLGVEFIDTSVVSKLSSVYKTMDLSTALDLYADDQASRDQKSVMHCRTLKLSDGGTVDPALSRKYFTFDNDPVPVVTGVVFPEDAEGRGVMAVMLMLMVRSLAESNPGRKLVVYADSETAGDSLFALVMGHAQYWRKTENNVVLGITEEIRSKIHGGRYTYMRNLRMYLPLIATDRRDCVWLDSDTVVRQDLTFFASDARSAMRRNQFIAGVAVSPTSPAIDPGVMYMDLDGMRKSGASQQYPSAFAQVEKERGADAEVLFDVVNLWPNGNVDGRWNVRPYAMGDMLLSKPAGYRDEQIMSSYILHLAGDKSALPSREDAAAKMVFKYLAGIKTEITADSFDKLFDFDTDGRWRSRIEKEKT